MDTHRKPQRIFLLAAGLAFSTAGADAGFGVDGMNAPAHARQFFRAATQLIRTQDPDCGRGPSITLGARG